MTNTFQQENSVKAKLGYIEDNTAYLILSDSDEEIIPWPLSKLPEGMEVGDEINLSLDFELTEKRKEEIKKNAEHEAKYEDMRKMLEELVN